MAPKGRGRKKAEVVEEKLEVQDVANEGTKAKMGGKVTKAAKKVVTNGEKSNDLEVNGSGEPQAENGVGEEPVETDSGPDVATSDKVASKRGRKAKAKKEEPAEDEEQIDVVGNEKVASKRGRKAKAKKEESAEDEKSSNVQEKATDEEQIEAGSAPEVPTNDKVASKRGRKANAKKEESAEDEAKEESSNMERGDEAIAKDVPAKRGRKAAKIQNVGDSAKDEDKLETKTVEAKAPNSRRKLKPDAEPDSVEEPTEARTTRTRKVQLKEGSVEKEATSKGSGRKRKNVGKPEPEVAKKVKDEKHQEIDENRQLKVALKRNKSLDEMARQQREDEDEADAFEEPKVKNVKGPAKGKGKRAAASDAEESQPTKKPKESANSKGAAKKEKDKIPDVTALNFDNESKTKDGKPWNLKIATWNVNGVRAWLEKNGMSFLHHEKPDIMCIQETKCSDDKLPPEVNVEGYHCYWLAGDKDGYSGVGLLSKEKPISVQYGINVEKHDNEGRVITAEYDEFYLVTTYIPNAGRGLVRLDYRQEWDEDFRSYLKKLDKKKPVVLCGDLNVAHEEIDLANPKTNKKNAGFTKEEREGFSTLLSEGFVDTFRHLYPDQKGAYTFWTYMMNARAKNVGWRLDYFVVSERLIDHLCDNVIRKDVYGSDHCPITLFLHV